MSVKKISETSRSAAQSNSLSVGAIFSGGQKRNVQTKNESSAKIVTTTNSSTPNKPWYKNPIFLGTIATVGTLIAVYAVYKGYNWSITPSYDDINNQCRLKPFFDTAPKPAQTPTPTPTPTPTATPSVAQQPAPTPTVTATPSVTQQAAPTRTTATNPTGDSTAASKSRKKMEDLMAKKKSIENSLKTS